MSPSAEVEAAAAVSGVAPRGVSSGRAAADGRPDLAEEGAPGRARARGAMGAYTGIVVYVS